MCMCVFWRGLNIAFFALPNPLSCSVMNKMCLNQSIDDKNKKVASKFYVPKAIVCW